jgi:hypothetical protein
MAAYTCYGLTLRSDIPLPELGAKQDAASTPDVVIERGVATDPPLDAVMIRDGMWRSPTSIGIDIPQVARFVAHEGRRIVVESEPGVSDGDVRIFLLGTMIGSIMMQRDHLVLHGTAFRVGTASAVVVGHSGAGKSTLAAELARRGVDVLSDDVVPVDAVGRGLPGYPRIKLWRDALESLGLEPHRFDRIAPSHEKYHVPIERGDLSPLPVRWIYSLETHEGPDLELACVVGIGAFSLLNEHTYRRELIHDQATSGQHLRQCAQLAGQARVVQIIRPAATMTASLTADALMADIHEQPHPVRSARLKESA